MLGLLLWAAPASAQRVDQHLWGTNGNVMDVARAGNTIYLAGYFTRVGPITGGGVPLDRQLGQPADPFPRVAGAANSQV